MDTAGCSPTILVVDDEPLITNLCARILEEAGFAVLTAEGSSEALQICTEHQGPIELLLTDLILPPPGFQLASSSNRFPHVHGHVLAARAAAIRKGLHVALMSGNPDHWAGGTGEVRPRGACASRAGHWRVSGGNGRGECRLVRLID
jgi:CheY-like chemotaxis protein